MLTVKIDKREERVVAELVDEDGVVHMQATYDPNEHQMMGH